TIANSGVANGRSRLAQSHYLGVSCWVGIGQVAIEPATHNFSLAYDYGPDRNLASLKSPSRLPQGFEHPDLVAVLGSAILHDLYCICGRRRSEQTENHAQGIRHQQAKHLRNNEAEQLVGQGEKWQRGEEELQRGSALDVVLHGRSPDIYFDGRRIGR